ncbi:MAG TPA: hypothetical protein DD979_10015 [Gammaproteobacteria bacterium]|jgi:prepilin-type N-terminal cleavage/methylation domain-containing protein|nr:hypothetical protein [Gammaproteobacteria bacterium]
MKPGRAVQHRHQSLGFSLLELLISLAIAASLMAGVSTLVGESLQAEVATRHRLDVIRDARFAMQRMTQSIGRTRLLLVPLVENPATAWSESTRDVLAVALDPTLDRDRDGWADANNDKDFQDSNQNGIRDPGEAERVDEDTPADMTHDGAAGIIGIDDNGDGIVDGVAVADDDEDGVSDEETGVAPDPDNDGSQLEDVSQEGSQDSQPGLAGVDDDEDGSIDEGALADDDEDGTSDEDWVDPVVFYLNGSTLIERTPALSATSGADYVENVVATGVTAFQVERLATAGKRYPRVAVSLTLTAADGQSYTLSGLALVGGDL